MVAAATDVVGAAVVPGGFYRKPASAFLIQPRIGAADRGLTVEPAQVFSQV